MLLLQSAIQPLVGFGLLNICYYLHFLCYSLAITRMQVGIVKSWNSQYHYHKMFLSEHIYY